jgi:hypothetical protein
MGIEFVHLTADTKPEDLEHQLMVDDFIWKFQS